MNCAGWGPRGKDATRVAGLVAGWRWRLGSGSVCDELQEDGSPAQELISRGKNAGIEERSAEYVLMQMNCDARMHSDRSQSVRG